MPFHHEKLKVYQHAIEFVGWVGSLIEGLPRGVAVKAQLDRASTSIPLNIAEGNGRWSSRDKTHFLQIATGSSLECAACLDVLVARELVTSERVGPGKHLLLGVVELLNGLARSMERRVSESPEDYD